MKPFYFRRGLFLLASILLSLLVITAIFTYYDWDRQIVAWFYTNPGWALTESQPWQWLYRYGTLPGLVFTLGAAGCLCLSFMKPQWVAWRRYALIILLTSVVGGGIVVNGILKDHWGRARPLQIEEFGGKWEYQHAHQMGIAGKGKSFPSGHSFIAYIFVSLIIFYPKSRWFSLLGVLFGLGYGILMSVARMGQGAHYPTDTLWSLGIVLLSTTFFYYFMFPPSSIPFSQTTFGQKKNLRKGLGFVLILGGMAVFFLIRRPIFEDYRHALSVSPQIQEIHLHTNIHWDDITIHSSEKTNSFVQTLIQGLGGFQSAYKVKVQHHSGQDGVLYIDYQVIPQGYFAKTKVDMSLYLPEHLKEKVIAIP